MPSPGTMPPPGLIISPGFMPSPGTIPPSEKSPVKNWLENSSVIFKTSVYFPSDTFSTA